MNDSMKIMRLGILSLLLLFLSLNYSQAHEFSAEAYFENYFFMASGQYEDQQSIYPSIAIQPEYHHCFENEMSLAASLFGRFDFEDARRSHTDVREFMMNYPLDDFEINLGIGKTFWGATEFYHLVDIINQTDLVESSDGEEKLGQPMLHVSMTPDIGDLDFYALPYFRERTFPGKAGRFRSSLVVDTDNAVYESSAGQHHLDFAMRYSRTFGDMDFGVYYFNGTNRSPTLVEEAKANTEHVLIPHYNLIQQVGADIQFVRGRWLLKYEGIYQTGGEHDYFALTGGVEYTFQSIFNTHMDLGVICEYAYDDRADEATTTYDNDIMTGLRWVTNSLSSVEVLAGMMLDLDKQSRLMTVEISGRLSERIKLFADAAFFANTSSDDYLNNIRDDDYISMKIGYYF